MEEEIKVSFWAKHKGWIIALIILLVLVIAFFALTMPSNGILSNVTRNTPRGIPDCPADNSIFTHTPVMLDDFTGLVPLGNMDPSSHVFPTDHIYFHPEYDEELGMNHEVDVYAMGDMWITQISSSQNSIDGEVLHTDYSVNFAPCKDISGYFLHMTTLSDKLKNAFEENEAKCSSGKSTGGRDYETCQARVKVEVSAGEKIATGGGLKNQGAFDLGMLDYRIDPLKHANNKRWTSEKHKYTVCPFDQFVSPLREELTAKFSSMDGDPIVGKDDVCGRIDWDVVGTAQGVWFTKGFKGFSPEDTHLALAPHNYEVGKQTFSVGTSISGVESDTYLFDPKSQGNLDLDFSRTVPGETYCYDLFVRDYINPPNQYTDRPFTMLFQMPDEDSLKIKKGSSESCGSAPYELGSDYIEFER